MGDVIMTGPAMRALKETFNTRITLLTSTMAKDIVKHMPEVDEAIILDLPWVKNNAPLQTEALTDVVNRLKNKKFDAAVIFTVYSQSALPTAMLAYLAKIKTVLAYCRENPYGLLSHWVPDEEPYNFIKHQVRRDLDLVKTIGASARNEKLYLTNNDHLWAGIRLKLAEKGLRTTNRWIILHAGVSENKREYPFKNWVDIGRHLISKMGLQVLFTGTETERALTNKLQQAVGKNSYSVAGWFNLEEFICLVKNTPLMVSVNTGTVHIAAAVGTPVVVLYAQTNPQHTPWQAANKVLEFGINESLQSRNEVIAYVNKTIYNEPAPLPSSVEVVSTITQLIAQANLSFLPLHETPNENQETPAS